MFADFCSGTIFGVDANGDRPQEPEVLLETDLGISSFGVDRSGELYVTDLAGGRVFKLVGR